ncbi:Protein of unknown function [Bacillus mycoides]|uniref:Uncharacterized protein n=1 Tax=Bacillus mycoides TaxID=1405 RepID=A0A1D3MLH4_BACMY|nr:Protein of unknown function [Bacillus mycoides]SCM86809.1 Protein of unknown function [Bacillus mycoides]
MMKEKKGL